MEGRKILATISRVDLGSEPETDCSHLVHDVYEQAGFPYDYATSGELYVGNTNFTRVRVPQAGDLIVWRGHVGIVIDPGQHSFYSFVRSGPDTQFYDSPYWRSRGIARFFRYMTEEPINARRALEAAGHADHQPLQVDGRSSDNHPLSKQAKPVSTRAPKPAPVVDGSSPIAAETPREVIFQVAGKNPSPEEIAAAFAEMNQDSGQSLLPLILSRPGKAIIVYRELRISAVQIKGKHGTALLRIESIGIPTDTQTGSQPRWREQSLEFEKTKSRWVMSPVQDVAYVKREVALKVLSARLAELSKITDAAPEQRREQTQIIRLLNSFVTDDSATASSESN